MGSPSEFEDANEQSENVYDKQFVSFQIYLFGCLLCSFFGGVIGWIIRDMLIR